MSELTKIVLADEDKKAVGRQGEREKEGTGTVTPLPLIKDKQGQLKRNRANLTRLLTYHDEVLRDLFIYNEATHNIEITEDRKLGFHELKKGAFSDIIVF